MLTNLLYFKIVVSLFLALVLWVEWRRARRFEVKLLLVLFAVYLFKETFALVYLSNWIPFDDTFRGVKDLAEFRGNWINSLGEVSKSTATAEWERILPDLNQFRWFWHVFEVLFAAVLFHVIHRWTKLDEHPTTRRVVAIVNGVLLLGALTVMLLFREELPADRFGLFFLGFGVWSAVLLAFAAIFVGKIDKYTMLDVKFLVSHKAVLVVAMLTLLLFSLLSGVVNILTSVYPLYLHAAALAFFALFGYQFMIYVMNEMDNRVVGMENERTLVIKLLQDIGHAMAENLSQGLVMERIVEAAKKATDARSGAVLLIDQHSKTLQVAYVAGFYPPVQKMELGGTMVKEKFLTDKFRGSRIKLGESYLGLIAQNGEALFIKDALHDERIEQTAGGLMDIRSVIAVPLKVQDEILGVMAIMNKETSMFFTEGDLSLMMTLADQAAITLNQVKLYQEMLEKKQAEKELNVAGSIQMGLLPSVFPEFPKVEFAAFSHPAKGVGGDYYDLLDFGNGKVGVIITDVAGKGVPAALVMVMIRSVLRTYAKQDKEAKDVISTVNDTISGEVSEERYATMFYFVFDSEFKILNYCNAGHGPLLLYRRNLDSFALLDTEGMPVGIAPGVEYGQEYTSLHSGDIAVLYTDGVTECMNMEREQFGLETLKQVLRENKDLSATELSDTIYRIMKDFAGGAPQHDDETLLLMKAK